MSSPVTVFSLDVLRFLTRQLCASSGEASRSRRPLFPFLPPCRDPLRVPLWYGASLNLLLVWGEGGKVRGAPALPWPGFGPVALPDLHVLCPSAPDHCIPQTACSFPCQTSRRGRPGV